MFQTTPGLLSHIRKNIHLPMSFVRFKNLPASANSAQTAKIDFSSLVGDLKNAAWGENLALHFPKYLGREDEKKK
jgi:hypothetical protein